LTIRIRLFEDQSEREDIMTESRRLVRAFLKSPPPVVDQNRYMYKAELARQLVQNVPPTDLDILNAAFAVKNTWDLQDTNVALAITRREALGEQLSRSHQISK
jgi:hypothetical protein